MYLERTSPHFLNLIDTPQVFEDFQYFSTGGMFTSVVTSGGSCAAGNGIGGIVALVASGGSPAANDNTYLRSTNKVLEISASQPIYIAALVQFTEMNTNQANVIFGLADTVAAATLVNGSAGVETGYSGAVFFKQGGANTNWQVQCSDSTSGQQTATTNSPAGGSNYAELGILIQPITGTLATVSYFVNGAVVIDPTYHREIKHQLTFASPALGYVFCGVKNGATVGGGGETLNVDYIRFSQKARDQ